MTHWGVWCATTEDWHTEDDEIWLGTAQDCILKASHLRLVDYERQVMSGREEAYQFEARPFKGDVS